MTIDENKLKIHHVSNEEIEKWDKGVGVDSITDGSITTVRLADNAVTTSKISNLAVTGDKLGSGSVTTAKIANGSITSGKIGVDAVTADKIQNVGSLNSDLAIGIGATATGSGTVAIGLSSSTTQVACVAVGFSSSSSNGASCVALGSHSTSSGSSASTAIGSNSTATHAFSTALGALSTSTTANQILLGSTGQTPFAHRALSVISDQRDKSDISLLKYNALEFINKIEPKQYKLDFRSDYTRQEEITEGEYEQLDDYTKHHRVSNIPVYSINNEIEFIEYLFDEEEITSQKRNNTNQDQFKTIIKSNVLRSRKEAIEKYKANYNSKRSLLENTEDIQELTEEIIEQNITKVRDMKLLRKFLPKDGSKTNNRYHNGVLAQQVKQVADEMGFDFCGFKDHSVNGGDDLYSISYEEFIAPMIGEIQQLTKKLESQETIIKELVNTKMKEV